MDPGNWAGDKGYVGHGMITPFKKPAGGELLEWQKEFNTQVNKLRYVIEQVIAKLQNLADHAHRLSAPDRDFPYHDLSCYCSALLQDRLNNPP